MLHALIVTTLAGLSTGIGGMLAVIVRPSDRLLAFSMGFAGGVMITVSLADLAPAALRYYNGYLTPLGSGAALVSLLAAGGLLAALLEKCLPEDSPRLAGLVADSRRRRALRTALVTGLALLLHNLPEGILTLFTGVQDPRTGLRMALAIALHNLPEGLAVAVPLFYATGSRPRAVAAAFGSGAAEPIGALLAWLLLHRWLTPAFLNGTTVLVAGIMSWVAAAQLLPGGFAFDGKKAAPLGFAAGVLAMLLGIAALP